MRYSQTSWVQGFLIASLLLSLPQSAIAHAGHGDEFQATGGIERVQVNPETDEQLGIRTAPIEQATPDGVGVMIPATALVDADGKQLVFVKYENFYEPVEVTTGDTQDDLITVTEGLSIGELLVTEGSLMLYAQSRKTPTVDASPESSPVAVPTPQANTVDTPATGSTDNQNSSQPAKGLPIKLLATGGGAVILVGAIAFLGANRKKKGDLSNGGY